MIHFSIDENGRKRRELASAALLCLQSMGKEHITGFGDCQTSTYGVPLAFNHQNYPPEEQDNDNNCSCAHGLPPNGTHCLIDGNEECESCDFGYHIEASECVLNTALK